MRRQAWRARRLLWGIVLSPAVAWAAPRAVPGDGSAATTADAEAGGQARLDLPGAQSSGGPLVTQQTPVGRVVIGKGSGTTAGVPGGGRLVYSNTLGNNANAGLGTAYRLADDLVTTASDGCRLDHYEFEVTGSQSGGDLGPFAVTFGLYDGCPGRGGQPIEGTSGQAELPDSGVYWIEFRIPPETDVVIPNTVWLSVSFDRAGAGWMGGAPALVGYSDDTFEDSVFGCAINFGGYPRTRHASFNAQLFVRDDCPSQFLAYRARTPALTTYVPGAGVRVADDIRLDAEACQLVSYTVAVRGAATFDMDLRLPAPQGVGPGEIIPGTQATVQTLRAGAQYIGRTFDPPIPVPTDVWVTLQNSSTIGRVSLAGRPANIGDTEATFAIRQNEVWTLQSLEVENQTTAMDVSMVCAGHATSGSCCDLLFPDERGEAVCREVPRANCAFQRWLPDVACAPDPFRPFCGQAACCLADGTCTDLTQNECRAQGVDWHSDLFCGAPELECDEVCVVSDLSCSFPHDTPGCAEPICCATVCDNLSGVFCCNFFWDDACASLAAILCDQPPSNDECVPGPWAAGVYELPVPSSIEVHTDHATTGADDPGFCCHDAAAPRCAGGNRDGNPCQTDAECEGGVCVTAVGAAAPRGYGSVWFRFTVPPPSSPEQSSEAAIELSTCRSSSARDSLLQVFAVADPDLGICNDLGRCFDGSPCAVSVQDCADGTRCVTSREPCSVASQNCPGVAACVLDLEAACHELIPVGCADDSESCSSTSTHARLCVPGLRRGDTYVAELAGKDPDDLGTYRLEVREVPECSTESGPANGFCAHAQPIGDGDTHFDLSGATLDCPVDLCSAPMARDVWFDYTAAGAGRVTMGVFATGQPPGPTPTLAVYEGCQCFPSRGLLHACATGPASQLAFRVDAGQCFKIRVGNLAAEPAEGTLRITSSPDADCPAGEIEWLDPPSGVVDARAPGPPGLAGRQVGIDRLLVHAPPGAELLDCWSLCETDGGDDPNAVWSVVSDGPDQVTVFLARGLSPGGVTTISYSAGGVGQATGQFTVHPGNANGDPTVSGDDLVDLIGVLTGAATPEWGRYSVDFDHDGTLLPVDLLSAVEVFRGSGLIDAWQGTSLPLNDGRCP